MNKKSVLLKSVLVLALLVSLTNQVFASAGNNENNAGRERKIVVFQNNVGEIEQQEIISRSGGSKLKSLPLINGAVVLVGSSSESALHQQAEVLRVESDTVYYIQVVPAIPGESLPWGVDRIDAERAWDPNNDLKLDAGAGNGVRVAILDTGIDLDHPDLKDNIKGGINTINPMATPDDDSGHGTHVAGIIAAAANNVGIVGIAPRAQLFAVKVLDKNGAGFTSDIIEGIQWSIENRMQVINMSFGAPVMESALHEAIIAAHNAGIVLVAAAGNLGPGDSTVIFPAALPEVIAVSATDSSDALVFFSSRGPEVELAAPGVNILSTLPGDVLGAFSGTSMAAPHVTGTAALIIESGIRDANNNGRINDEVRSRLQRTADDLGDKGRDNLFGFGLVDAEEAFTGRQTLP
ncbi:MAG: S8 family peptidase [Chloroflexi bacterium]|nr:S8 family peptidase [Chloroflexota bacterium]